MSVVPGVLLDHVAQDSRRLGRPAADQVRRAGRPGRGRLPGRSARPVAPPPGGSRPRLAAGLPVAVNRRDGVTAVPPGTTAGGTLPVGPGEQHSGLAAGALAGTAPAERRHPKRHQPEGQAGDASENQADHGALRAEGTEGEHSGQGKNQPHVNDGSTQPGSLQWAIWRATGLAMCSSRVMYPALVL
jgi:hypothetical protein